MQLHLVRLLFEYSETLLHAPWLQLFLLASFTRQNHSPVLPLSQGSDTAGSVADAAAAAPM